MSEERQPLTPVQVGWVLAWAELTLGMVRVAYEKDKDEQHDRIARRDHHVYLVGGLVLAAGAGALQARHAGVLLGVPLLSLLLGWVYLANDDKVTDIGRCVRTEQKPAAEAVLEYVRQTLTAAGVAAVLPSPPAFGWETFRDPRRGLRKVTQLAADLLTFCVTPLAAVSVYWAFGPWPPVLVAASIVAIALTVALGVLIVVYADLGPKEAEQS